MAAVDELPGRRGRSGLVRSVIEHAVTKDRSWQDIEPAAGSIEDNGHG